MSATIPRNGARPSEPIDPSFRTRRGVAFVRRPQGFVALADDVGTPGTSGLGALHPAPSTQHPTPGATVIARAPVRLSFGGGGTDLPAYSDRFGGLVVSAAVTRYATAVASPSPDGGVGVNSADYRTWVRWPAGVVPDDGEPLSLPRAALAWFAERGLLPGGVELFTASEAPPGSGLGSSSAMAVAVVGALAAYAGLYLDAAGAAALACHLEIGRLGRPIGRQDQYAAALGGVNAIAFEPDGAVRPEPLDLAPETLAGLQAGLLLLSTGRTRDSASILAGQRARTEDGAALGRLHRLKALAREMRSALEAGDLAGFGGLLDEGWRQKRGLAAGISTGPIDRWYLTAREAGALGGKVCGAGGGGFLLLFAPPARRADVLAALAPDGLTPLAVAIDPAGVRVHAG
jgi:D-glycero-alpha-D-manno-heptose-7-phosphate kinase